MRVGMRVKSKLGPPWTGTIDEERRDRAEGLYLIRVMFDEVIYVDDRPLTSAYFKPWNVTLIEEKKDD
jgi:hypothetical protein